MGRQLPIPALFHFMALSQCYSKFKFSQSAHFWNFFLKNPTDPSQRGTAWLVFRLHRLFAVFLSSLASNNKLIRLHANWHFNLTFPSRSCFTSLSGSVRLKGKQAHSLRAMLRLEGECFDELVTPSPQTCLISSSFQTPTCTPPPSLHCTHTGSFSFHLSLSPISHLPLCHTPPPVFQH